MTAPSPSPAPSPAPAPVPALPPRITNPELKAKTEVRAVRTRRDLREFLNAPWKVHWGDPYFVPRLVAEERWFLDPARNPFFRHAERELFIAKHGEPSTVGTIAACIDRDFDAARGVRAGFFGFFDFLHDARVPEALLRAAVAWLRERGAVEIYGPCQLAPSHEAGLLVDGFQDDPAILTPYNPAGYASHFQRLGLEPWQDLLAYEVAPGPAPERLRRAAEGAARRHGAGAATALAVRPLDRRRLREETLLLRRIHEEAWRHGPLGRPVREEEALALAERLRTALDPAVALVLEAGGEPQAFAVALPDLNPVVKELNGRLYPFGWLKLRLARHAVDRARIALVCARDGARRRPGLVAPLLLALWEGLAARRYARVEISPVLGSDRRTRALLERLGARRTKTWRLFRVPPGWQGPSEA